MNIQGFIENLFTSFPYEPGTKIKVSGDDPGTIREICGYEIFRDRINIIFQDGAKLNLFRNELILEVCECR